jgi:hypothetical protein
VERVRDISAEIRRLIAQLEPLAVEIISLEYEPGQKLLISYIDSKGQHELVTWAPVSWETLD